MDTAIAPYRRARVVTAGTLLCYVLLVATHLGEFWPFSIYPMFSRGSHPWTRVVLRDVSTVPSDQWWEPVLWTGDLPGTAFPLGPTGINQNDVANFVSKTEDWNSQRVSSLRKVFADELDQSTLLVVRVSGRVASRDSTTIEYVPFIVLSSDSTFFNPQLVSTN